MNMPSEDNKGVFVGRRDFLKTTTMAGMAATLPATLLQNSEGAVKPGNRGNKRKLLLLGGFPDAYENLIQSVQSIKEYEFTIVSIKTNYSKPQEIIKIIRTEAPDILFFGMPGTLNAGNIPVALGYIDVPVILLPAYLDLIMLEADVAAAFRANGTNAVLANSETHAIELIKILAAPRLLEGKRAVIYGRPFDSSSVPARNLDAETVYKRTGVRLEFRPLEQLKPLLETVDPAGAGKEMERWKKGAVSIVEPTDKELLESCKMYVLLRSIIEKEELSGISMDCLNFSFNSKPVLPIPCLAFARLRDEGYALPCEADVCGMLTTMVLQEISRKPSYFCNISSVDVEKSSTVLRHCVAPLHLLGRNAATLPYNLRDYHGTGRGAVPEVSFPRDLEVTLGGFSKDLKKFVMWPGRIQQGIHDTDRLSYNQRMPEFKNMRRYCSNRAELKIKEVDVFLQKIVGIHHVMVAGIYTKELREEMMRLNVDVIGPVDTAAPVS
jgi:L-fucose isomerase-like protein